MFEKRSDQIICIGAYCPDDDRKKLLVNLLETLQDKRNEFDILLFTRSALEESLFSLFDYCIFNRFNDVIYDREYCQDLLNFYSFWNKKIFTQNGIVSRNTHIPALYNMLDPLNYSKYLGYSVFHMIEYDSVLKEAKEIRDNYELIKKEGFDVIYYTHPDPQIKKSGSLHSFNLKKELPCEFREFSLDANLESINRMKKTGIYSPELYLKEIIDSHYKNVLVKPINLLNESSGDSYSFRDNRGSEEDLFSCFFETPGEGWSFFLGSRSKNTISRSILLKVNGSIVWEKFDLVFPPSHWYLYPVSVPESLLKIHSIEIDVAGYGNYLYEFKTPSDFDNYRKSNFIEFS